MESVEVLKKADRKLTFIPVLFILLRMWGTIRFFRFLACLPDCHHSGPQPAYRWLEILHVSMQPLEMQKIVLENSSVFTCVSPSTSPVSSAKNEGYVHAILDSFSCQHEKLFGITWTATAQNWNKLAGSQPLSQSSCDVTRQACRENSPRLSRSVPNLLL